MADNHSSGDSTPIRDFIAAGPFGLITDIDGTISPIAPSPEQAQVTPLCRRYLLALSKKLPLVAAVSGRPAREARQMVGVSRVVYVGNHGFERWENGKVVVDPSIARYRRPLMRAVARLRKWLSEPGILVEDKGATASIHYRLASAPEAAGPKILDQAQAVATAEGLRVTKGRMVVEIRPPVEANKGTAVLGLINDYSLTSVAYIGDDVTDLDAFAALHSWRQETGARALIVAVLNPESGSELMGVADKYLVGVRGVERFLAFLAGEVSRPTSTGLRTDDTAT